MSFFTRRDLPPEVGLDLGARWARAIGTGPGEVVEIASRARQAGNGWVTGHAAREGDPPARRPIVDGVIVDTDAWAAVAHAVARTARPTVRAVIAALPADTSDDTIALLAGTLATHDLTLTGTVPTHVAAALGADLPVTEPEGSMVVVAGASRVDVAVLSLGGTVVHRAVRAGLDTIDAALAQAIRREARVTLTAPQIRQLRRDIVDAGPSPASRRVVMTARRLDDGTPVDIVIDGALLSPALDPVLDRVAATLLDVLRETPPELCADLVDRGVILLGGGAVQRGLDDRLREATGLPFLVPDAPAHAIPRGLARILADPALRRMVLRDIDP